MNESLSIEKRIDKQVTGGLAVGCTGQLAFTNVNEMMEVAKLMSLSQVAVPKHLRENPGACLAVVIQASTWEMSPFAVANKSYSVNDRLSYEAQMINAVILNRAPIVGRFKITYDGEGDNLTCTVVAKGTDGDDYPYTSPKLREIPTKNSPLWKADPKQQLFYYSSRALCRRHFPDVLLGVYTPEELSDEPRDVTPDRPQSSVERLKARRVQSAPEDTKPLPEAATEAVEAPVEVELVQPEPEPEVDECLADFLLSITDMTEAGELQRAIEQAEDFDAPEKVEAAKKAILKRSKHLGLQWNKSAGCFVSQD